MIMNKDTASRFNEDLQGNNINFQNRHGTLTQKNMDRAYSNTKQQQSVFSVKSGEASLRPSQLTKNSVFAKSTFNNIKAADELKSRSKHIGDVRGGRTVPEPEYADEELENVEPLPEKGQDQGDDRLTSIS